MKIFLSFVCVLSVSLSIFNVEAQGVKTPFEYPTAPDTCSTLESRCNYLVVNFWNNYDIRKPITNDAEFETAFRDYVNFFKYAHRNIVLSSVRDFVFKARSNTSNLIKLGRVAETVLYGPYAEFWSDELYMEFARFIQESNQLKASDRNYYKRQVELISKCLEGNTFPDFDVYTAGGKSKLSSINNESVILFFTDNESSSSIDRLRLSTDVSVNTLISGGKFTVVQIYSGKPSTEWYNSQPENWVNVGSDQLASNVDLRGLPSCYILDENRKILTKNVTVDDIKKALTQ